MTATNPITGLRTVARMGVLTVVIIACSSSPPATERVNMPPEPAPKCTSNDDCEPGFFCETSVGECLSSVLERCEYRPLTDGFRIREEWAWTGDADVLPAFDQVMATPVVANLTDDNGDGNIDENDVPDVVFNTFSESTGYRASGVLRAISGDGGSRVWPTKDPGYRTLPSSVPALADVDPNSPGPEVIACENWLAPSGGRANTLIVLASDGSVLHRYREAGNTVRCFGRPAVGDMNGDGVPEIVEGLFIAHGDGTRVRLIEGSNAESILLDVDDDGDLELVTSRGAYNYDGTPVWEATDDRPLGGFLAAADLDADSANPSPEIIVMHTQTNRMWAFNGATGELRWGGADINPPGTQPVGTNGLKGGGPPLIANFDDDPFPEVGVAGGFAYSVFGHDGMRQWDQSTTDLSSRSTGSSVFDFEGDGIAEVLYNDERNFHVYRGTDGSQLLKQCNTSGTIHEFPIVVDVDNDARAEVVLTENNYGINMCDDDATPSTNGIHVYGHPDGEWVGTKRIYNQFSYHITNINEDGTVPKREEPHWRLPVTNSFRKNIALFDVPDLIAEDLEVGNGMCPEHLELSVHVINRGAAVSAPNIPVSFFLVADDGAKTYVGQSFTSKRLNSGDFERVTFAYPVAKEQLDNTLRFMASINHPDHEPLTELRECHTDNNDSETAEDECKALF